MVKKGYISAKKGELVISPSIELPEIIVLPNEEERRNEKDLAAHESLSDTIDNIIPYEKWFSQTNTKKVYDDSDNSDSDKSHIICQNSRYCKCNDCTDLKPTHWREQLERELSPFFMSLPTCLLFDAGFRVKSPSKICWCPCGKYLCVWREAFNLQLEEIDDTATIQCDGEKITKQGLLDHCRAHAENCCLHFGIMRYL